MASEKPAADPAVLGQQCIPATALPDASAADQAPPQPPRPASPNTHNQNTLKEAFPEIDAAVIKAILLASGGQLEPAFNALLSMSDPSAVENPPPPPPRPQNPPQARRSPAPTDFVTSTPQDQLDADAELALKLQQEFGAAPVRRSGRGGAGNYHATGPHPAQRKRVDRRGNNDSDEEYYHDDDRDHSFFDDDLPVIKDNIKKGFIETQTKVNSWLTDFKKRLDSEFSPETSPPISARSSGQYARAGNRRSYDPPRRSRDQGYDADPAVISDDFTHLDLKDNMDAPQRRQKANPNLFQSSGKSASGRSVSFDERPTNIDDDELYRKPGATASPARQPSPGGGSKWEPLQTVDPTPMDRDPFSLGDSDDEKDGLLKEGDPPKPASITGPQESGITKAP